MEQEDISKKIAYILKANGMNEDQSWSIACQIYDMLEEEEVLIF